MASILFIIGGLIGAGNAFNKNLISCWIFLVNLLFAVYTSIFISPLAIKFLEIPGLPAGYKNAIAVGGIFIFADIVLNKITEQIIGNDDKRVTLPSFVKFLSAGTGFFSGILIVAVLMYCFTQMPFSNGFSGIKDFRASSGNGLMAAVHTVNIFSFQLVSQDAEKDLKSLQILPSDNIAEDRTESGSADGSKNTPQESKKKAGEEQKTQPEPKKKTADPVDDFDF